MCQRLIKASKTTNPASCFSLCQGPLTWGRQT